MKTTKSVLSSDTVLANRKLVQQAKRSELGRRADDLSIRRNVTDRPWTKRIRQGMVATVAVPLTAAGKTFLDRRSLLRGGILVSAGNCQCREDREDELFHGEHIPV